MNAELIQNRRNKSSYDSRQRNQKLLTRNINPNISQTIKQHLQVSVLSNNKIQPSSIWSNSFTPDISKQKRSLNRLAKTSMGDINKDFAEGDETLMKIDSDYDNQTSNNFLSNILSK